MDKQDNLGMDIKSTPYVLVYGTLKQGGSNSHLMEGAEYVANGIVYGYGTLLNTYPPFFSKEVSPHPFKGELYRVDEAILAKLDRLEGHPHGYYRTQVDAFTSEVDYTRAWCYFYYAEPEAAPAALENVSFEDKAHIWKE